MPGSDILEPWPSSLTIGATCQPCPEVHDPVFKFLYFILFSITVFNWFTDLIGAHWDITLFLLRDGVRGANKMLAYICHLFYM